MQLKSFIHLNAFKLKRQKVNFKQVSYFLAYCKQQEEGSEECYYKKLFEDDVAGAEERYQVAAWYLVYYGAAEFAGKAIAYRLVAGLGKKLSAWMNYVYAACMLLAGTLTVAHACVVNVAFLQAYVIGECSICKNFQQ